jgi:hypothetical protein
MPIRPAPIIAALSVLVDLVPVVGDALSASKFVFYPFQLSIWLVLRSIVFPRVKKVPRPAYTDRGICGSRLDVA